MSKLKESYLMENIDEIIRLEIKTDPEKIEEQAAWCGLKPGLRVLDAGCGPGYVTSLLYDLIQPNGEIVGLDSSEQRIQYARKQYCRGKNIAFQMHDLKKPLDGFGSFDLIWVRFILEYHRKESPEIVKNLSKSLKPGGLLCLLDLDYNSLTHYELPRQMASIIHKIMTRLEEDFNFDPYSGRKLYSYLYDMGYENLRVKMMAHHLIYGKIKDEEIFNWVKKLEVGTSKIPDVFTCYSGGKKAFFNEFKDFLLDPRRFTYTPLILCTGKKPFVQK